MGDANGPSSDSRSGLDDFLNILSRFKTLSVTALGSAAVVPFAAYVANIMPPLEGIMLITGLVEIVTLVLVFQRLRTKPKRVIDRALTRSVVCLFGLSAVYLLMFLLLTFRIGSSSERGVRGFICSNELSASMSAGCPFPSRGTLENSEWDSHQVWVGWTVDLTLGIVALVWLACFSLLSFAIGSFLVYQTRVPAAPLPTAKRKPPG
jgi:hypothetical protein